MSGFKEPSFADRQKAALEARKSILEKFKAKPGLDDPEVAKRRVGEAPIVFPRSEPSLVDGRSVAKKPDPKLLNEIEIFLPMEVMPAHLHFIHAHRAVVDGRITILDAGGKEEIGRGRTRGVEVHALYDDESDEFGSKSPAVGSTGRAAFAHFW